MSHLKLVFYVSWVQEQITYFRWLKRVFPVGNTFCQPTRGALRSRLERPSLEMSHRVYERLNLEQLVCRSCWCCSSELDELGPTHPPTTGEAGFGTAGPRRRLLVTSWKWCPHPSRSDLPGCRRSMSGLSRESN